jgi:hypothetical protein
MMKNGIKTLRGMRVTVLERTFVDLLRAGESLSFLIAVFREAQNRKLKPSIPKIRRLGDLLHAKARTDHFLEALL